MLGYVRKKERGLSKGRQMKEGTEIYEYKKRRDEEVGG